MRVILVVFFSFRAVFVIVRLYLVELVNVSLFDRSALLTVVRLCFWDGFRYLRVLCEVNFVNRLVISAVNQWSSDFFTERLIFLHSIN